MQMTPETLISGFIVMTWIVAAFFGALYLFAWAVLKAGDAVSEWNFNRRVRNGDIPAPYRVIYTYEEKK